MRHAVHIHRQPQVTYDPAHRSKGTGTYTHTVGSTDLSAIPVTSKRAPFKGGKPYKAKNPKKSPFKRQTLSKDSVSEIFYLFFRKKNVRSQGRPRSRAAQLGIPGAGAAQLRTPGAGAAQLGKPGAGAAEMEVATLTQHCFPVD